MARTEQCLEACFDCHQACWVAVTDCLDKGGVFAESGFIRLLLDCADICQTTANFLMRFSELHPEVCGFCAQVCEKMAEQCEELHVAGAAEAGRKCAQVCREVLATRDDKPVAA